MLAKCSFWYRQNRFSANILKKQNYGQPWTLIFTTEIVTVVFLRWNWIWQFSVCICEEYFEKIMSSIGKKCEYHKVVKESICKTNLKKIKPNAISVLSVTTWTVLYWSIVYIHWIEKTLWIQAWFYNPAGKYLSKLRADVILFRAKVPKKLLPELMLFLKINLFSIYKKN